MKDMGNEHVMASDGNPESPPVNRLGFHEIVPGLGTGDTGEQPSHPIEIPEFNLNHQMMARHRKATATRRVGPKQKTPDEGQKTPVADATSPVQMEPVRSDLIWANTPFPDVNVLVADMVRSDIDRLCRAWAGLGA